MTFISTAVGTSDLITKSEYWKWHQQIHSTNFHKRVSLKHVQEDKTCVQNAVGHFKTHCRSFPPYCVNTISRFVFSDIKYAASYSDTWSDNSRHSTKAFRLKATQRSPLRHFAVSSSPRFLIQCAAVDVRFLHAMFKEGAGNVVVRPAYTRHI